MDDSIISTLKNLKGLTDGESRSLLVIMKQRKLLTKKEMASILKQGRCCASSQGGYNHIKELEEKQMIWESPEKKGYYQPIDPKQLHTECSNNLKKLEQSITDLDIKSEPYDFKEIDPRPGCCKIEQEHQIIATLLRYHKNPQFKLTFFYKDKSIDFWKEIQDNFKVKPIKGIFNCVIFENVQKDVNSGILLLSKRIDKKGVKFFGHLIMDHALINIFNSKRGVKK